MPSDLLQLTKYGLYCPQGDFYIDATGKTHRNIVTHAHADHARPGHSAYLAHTDTALLMRARLGKKIQVQPLPYNKTIAMNGVKVSLHPAGHIFGSAQVKVSSAGDTWVVSGDYKRADDRLSVPFEPLPCRVFVSECTFGLPVYRWPSQDSVYHEINHWWQQNRDNSTISMLYGYSLGKAQRILRNIDPAIGRIFVHRTVAAMNEVICRAGGILPDTNVLNQDTSPAQLKGSLVVAPPSAVAGSLFREAGPIETAMASGWALTGKNFGRRAGRGFVLSDHADWPNLLRTFRDTRAEKIITMHGYTAEMTQYLNETGTVSQEISSLQYQPYKL